MIMRAICPNRELGASAIRLERCFRDDIAERRRPLQRLEYDIKI
jgi:hypothetical protein